MKLFYALLIVMVSAVSISADDRCVDTLNEAKNLYADGYVNQAMVELHNVVSTCPHHEKHDEAMYLEAIWYPELFLEKIERFHPDSQYIKKLEAFIKIRKK